MLQSSFPNDPVFSEPSQHGSYLKLSRHYGEEPTFVSKPEDDI
jgi:hypothetical protein